MKKEQVKRVKNKGKELFPVNVHDQEEMIALGIHPRHRVSRDPSVWTKTSHEKELIKEYRHRYGRGIKKY